MRLPKILIIIAAFLGLTCFLYFGTTTKTKNHQAVEKSRAFTQSKVSPQLILAAAVHDLPASKQNEYEALELAIDQAVEITDQVELNKQMSSLWYQWGKPEISGWFAEKVAEMEDTAEAWSIAGNTYAAGLISLTDERSLDFAEERGRLALEQAELLEPTEIEHKVNLALTYVYRPLQDNPMKGIRMLLDLNKKHPNNVSVLRQLGRLAIQTGQFDKAAKRLRKAYKLDQENKAIACLLTTVYKNLNQQDSLEYFKMKCATK